MYSCTANWAAEPVPASLHIVNSPYSRHTIYIKEKGSIFFGISVVNDRKTFFFTLWGPGEGRGGVSTPLRLAFTQKSSGTHTWNFLTFPNFWYRIPLWIFFSTNLVYTIWQHTQYKFLFFIFCFNQKNQTLVEIIFRYQFKFFRPSYNQKEKNFTYGVLGIKIG